MAKSMSLAACAAMLAVCACGSGSAQQPSCKGAEAIAGPDVSANKRAIVSLSGSAVNTSGAVSYAWRLDAPAGSKAALSSSSVAVPTFTTDVAGDYVATFFVRDACGASAPATTVVTVVNHAPIASAGPGRQVMPGDTVVLDASGSADADHDPLQYRWSLVSRPAGSSASLSSATATSPTFTPDAYGTFVVLLVVSDGEDVSDPIELTVQSGVTDPNGTCPPAAPPVASAGPDQEVAAFSNAVQLDGSASTTGRPGALAFSWTVTSAPAGSHVSIDQPHGARPVLSFLDRPGNYVVSLVVNDGCVSSASASVQITRRNSVPSVFVYGGFQQMPVLVPFNLQGNAFDNDGEPLTFRWQIVSKPAGSTAAIADPTLLSTTFTPDVAGTYVFSLVASDAVSTSPAAQGTWTVVNLPPVAKPGADQAVAIAAVVTLDGSASSDPSLRPLTFAWTLERPAASSATLSSASVAKPTFTADVTGLYRAQLTVTAGGLSSQATVTVAVWPAVARLTHRVVDAAYSASLDRMIMVGADPSALYLLDPRGAAETAVALPLVPTSVAVDPAGQFAVVGHADAISYVDLQTKSVVRQLAVQGGIASLVLGDGGFAFAFPTTLSGDHARLLSVPVAGGASALLVSALVGAGHGRFRHANATLYVTANPGPFGGNGIEEYAVGSGVPTLVTPAAGTNAGTCGDLWLSEAGTRLFTRCGTAFRASSSSSDDLSAAGTLPHLSGVSLLLRHVSDSTAAGEISAVSTGDDPFLYPPLDDRMLRRWTADGLIAREALIFPAELVGTASFRWQGRFVFYRSDGSERYVLMQLDPAAGALQDFGFVVF